MRSTSFKKLGLFAISFFLCFSVSLQAQPKIFEVDAFNKVIVSPHIEVTFKKGDKESVIIESITESIGKFKVEVKNRTLELYLDGAKVITKSEKQDNNTKVPLYKGTFVKSTIIYKDVDSYSLRG